MRGKLHGQPYGMAHTLGVIGMGEQAVVQQRLHMRVRGGQTDLSGTQRLLQDHRKTDTQRVGVGVGIAARIGEPGRRDLHIIADAGTWYRIAQTDLETGPLGIIAILFVDVEQDGDERMVAEVLANPREVAHDCKTQAPQVRRWSYA